ncbi:tRNA (guanine(46)-N(7))-methyltransferase TrmB [Rhodopila sp.]|jgi:tRNA (guanine-N7-)-methyltransferase|uniref:tRNA (guanine(46)-N(7))-methyltransferase TrmB n=1 Tax=Rhodopila sp. TaxID=2480087 RepID=UPI002B6271A6|nr:tRNA (guanine(46)-N(7))-methyltransferase TrmB [Rhodopila sp.]HVZ06554.1 tRNA (guanine(46)-N(7))-methyltransferase TrmB [Rhodopila sp.]
MTAEDDAAPAIRVKPPPDRLYGRSRGHKLRPRQEILLNVTLPRLEFRPNAYRDRPLPSPLWVEIGFGGGEHAIAQARAHIDATLIACEVFENGICSLLSALVPEGQETTAALPPNLRVWTDDARTLLRDLPDACLDKLFLLFPDPWPKTRHAKRRFVHPAQLPLLARVMKAGAEWRIASDDPTYQVWVHDVMTAQTLFRGGPPATKRPEGWPPTRYEAKALRAGRQPLYWSFIRV